MIREHIFKLCIACLALSLLPLSNAAAQQYPSRPIRIIAPFPPGGGADLILRTLAPRMSALLGQPIVMDNRAGAGGIIGTELAAKSAPDGYTLVMGLTGTLAINPSLFAKLSYDPIKDFAPISLIATGLNVLVINPQLSPRTLEELIAFAKSNPKQLNYASSGIGGAPHLAGALFNAMAGVDIAHVPYKGGAQATADLLGGHVSIMFAGLGAVLPHLQSGRLVALGVAGQTRSAQLPNVRAIAEVLPGFAAETWFGLLAPKHTAPEIIERLNQVIRLTATNPEVAQPLSSDGYEVSLSTPQAFRDHLAREINKWAVIVKESGATLQ
jgi:tripartite-type tricarboxylate transporter receptor subunit TctC